MKRRGMACLLALLLACGPWLAIWAEAPSEGGVVYEEEDLIFKENDPAVSKDHEAGSELDKINDANASAVGSLGKKDWLALAKKARRTGLWRDDMVSVAISQVGYAQEKDGTTLYGQHADGWTALFIAWLADQAGVPEAHFPRESSYSDMCARLEKMGAVKKITRTTYPVNGDLALIEAQSRQLLGVVAYVSDGYAAVIHGDDNGRVTRTTYLVDSPEFNRYVDLNVLMERAGIDVGKGGEVPLIPEGGVTAWTNTNAVYLREEPTTVCRQLAIVKQKGTAMVAVSAQMQPDGYIWYGVRYGKYEGYIRGDLLELDRPSLATATPEPTHVPTATPVPGCPVCAGAAQGAALPWDCCYAHLAAMPQAEMARFMASLQAGDPASFALYIRAHDAHAAAGAPQRLCLGDACGDAAWQLPGPAHRADCPWHQFLTGQERVVNIEIREALDGQQVRIRCEMNGAVAWQWHEVRSLQQADGTTLEEDISLEGETADTLTVTARAQADTTFRYYCAVTLIANGSPVTVNSKLTQLDVGDAPILAQAILGEEVHFTYTCEGAAAYLWYVQKDLTAEALPIIASDADYAGAQTATLSFRASLENAGALYTCAALDEKGNILARSGRYAYALHAYEEAPDAAACTGHDLCRYIEELSGMTRQERYAALTETWNQPLSETVHENLAALVLRHWQLCHRETWPNLLCTCALEASALRHPTRDAHDAACPWAPAVLADLTITLTGMQSGESALMQVTVVGEGTSAVYTIALNDQANTATIAGLPAGSSYAVTELTSWAWRYGSQPNITPAVGVIAPTGNAVSITKEVSADRWLHDEGGVTCEFGQGAANTK